MTSQSSVPSERYEHLAVLGRGGAGTVYLVRDRTTGERIALKRLLYADEQSLLRLKQEFRSLADVHHPNLVKLYELGHDATSAFFTMEYLEGQELKQYLDARWAVAANDVDEEVLHIERVIAVFAQLAAAVSALHRAGLLHRDLKPSNVMMVDGRAVVLDFGIAVQVGSDAVTLTQEQGIRGTPTYMAPEQIEGGLIGEPNDWYAFGVMLYEALSGVLPIEGGLAELLVRKLKEDPTPISTLVAKLPGDVAELCMGLLRRAPGERPNGNEVTRVLRAHAARGRASSAPLHPVGSALSEPTTASSDVLAGSALFGRDAELAALDATFRRVQSGGFAVMHVAGESGSGKSSLVQRFTEEVEGDGFLGLRQPLVLRSRCYERETLPFKALDGAVDSLVTQLLRESVLVVSYALPQDVDALVQLFPIINRLPSAQRLPTGKPVLAASQARARAEAALSELLRRLATQRPIVLWIDDLQWGDLDSAGILTSWLGSSPIPYLMLVLSYRSEELSTSSCLRLLRTRSPTDSEAETTISLRALSDEHVGALCEQRLAVAALTAEARAELTARIVLEAQGSPFLATQLAALAVAQPTRGEHQLRSLSLQELVRSRSSGLSDDARRLLNVLSIAGRPLPVSVALAAASVSSSPRPVIYELRGLHLIRMRDVKDARLLEVYHDRLREVVQSLLTPEQRFELDRSLLAALQASGVSDSDWLHTLALAVGDRAAALRYGRAAAERAHEGLAFVRAAELYEHCLELTDDPAADGGELWEKLALAYAHAGHGQRAATVYLNAARQVGPEQALRFERAAASHLVCSGRYEEGEALVRRVLGRLGLDAPSSEAGQLAALAWERARLSLRGLSFTPRSPSEIDTEQHFRGEFLGMLSMETAAYDPLRAALFQARCLHTALDVGEPGNLARALCAAATMQCVSGSERGKRRADELLARAEAFSQTLDNSLLRTNLVSARAICAFLTGRIVESIALCDRAEQLHRSSSTDIEYHHRFTIVSARIGALLQIGEYRRAESELNAYLKEAEATGNINAELLITMAQAWADTIAARTDRARERLDRQRAQLPQQGFGLLHVLHMIAVLRIGCATGDYDWALGGTHAHWQDFQRSVVRTSEAFSMFAYEVHARALLNRAARDGSVRTAARAIGRHIRVLSGCNRADARAEALRLQARIAFMRDDRERAQRLYTQSGAGFDAHGARDQAARDRYALGILIGGERGQALKRDALALLAELGIAAPLQSLRGYIPEMLEPMP